MRRISWNRDKLPRSLLSSQTMYARLLDALAGMERDGTERDSLQPEMDVYITATDIQGLELPIELADKTVFEKRHKNVFHLRFGDGQNHFASEKNPFLAFAARATSAFPFAFEPACLEGGGAAEQFFPDYGNGYAARGFGDGGYLNNKPFTHAIQALSQRSSELPVTRKLMYVEPSPDQPGSTMPAGPAELPPQHTGRADHIAARRNHSGRPPARDRAEPADRAGSGNHFACGRRRQRFHRARGSSRMPAPDSGGRDSRSRAGICRIPPAEGAGGHRRSGGDAGAAFGRGGRLAADALFRTGSGTQRKPVLLEFDLGYRERRLKFSVRKLTDPGIKRKLNRIAVTLKSLRCPDVAAAAIADRFREVFIRAAADAEAVSIRTPGAFSINSNITTRSSFRSSTRPRWAKPSCARFFASARGMLPASSTRMLPTER